MLYYTVSGRVGIGIQGSIHRRLLLEIEEMGRSNEIHFYRNCSDTIFLDIGLYKVTKVTFFFRKNMSEQSFSERQEI